MAYISLCGSSCSKPPSFRLPVRKFELKCIFQREDVMQQMLTRFAVAMVWLAAIPLSSSAAVISFTPTHVSGNQWTYNYVVAATASDPTIEEFTIYFDQTLYANLAVLASPSGWDSLVIQPDSSLPDDGFFDALALLSGLNSGDSQSGFAVSFDFLGNGTPAEQRFDIVDPITLATLSSGFTSAAIRQPPPSDVPEPGTLPLAGLALALFSLFRKRTLTN
jgi:hypothetical protein